MQHSKQGKVVVNSAVENVSHLSGGRRSECVLQ